MLISLISSSCANRPAPVIIDATCDLEVVRLPAEQRQYFLDIDGRARADLDPQEDRFIHDLASNNALILHRCPEKRTMEQ